jgi:hypothetical protein
VYKNALRFYAAIAVRTGSKNDPHDKLDQKVLEDYGPVKPLTLEDVFGY